MPVSDAPSMVRIRSRYLLRPRTRETRPQLSAVQTWSSDLWDTVFVTKTHPTVAPGQNVFLVVVIASAPSNTRRRNAIRSTWGRRTAESSRFDRNTSTTLLPVFLVGECEDSSQRRLIHKEAKEFGDMLVGAYLDTYRNLTLKTIHGLLWVADHLRPSFVLKTDDDCFVNVAVLLDVLAETVVLQSEPVGTGIVRETSGSELPPGDGAAIEQTSSSSSSPWSARRAVVPRVPSPLYVGNIRWNNEVVRNPRSRWFVSERDYARAQYPPYGSGAGYVLDARALDVLARKVRRVRPFANEDAYVGTVLGEAGVRPVQSYRFVSQPSGLWTCNFLYVVVIHGVSHDDHRKLLDKVRAAREQCRDVERDVGWD
ncbi:beta-1,3-galactosyltransferase 4-like [Dermacentor albipictus]|uniref:beta-1,3-galactosyltransferase 4-like n=1 Tax=Dermacentor albipictus TaxID=60249 RepID=UPI0031FCFE56